MLAKKWWVSASFWNLSESLLTRGFDALTVFVLIYGLSVEVFGGIAWAQAWAAPLLFFFLLPELVLYRDFSDLRKRPVTEMLSYLRAFRIWAIGKAILAFVLAFVFGVLLSKKGELNYIPALLFALSLVLSPQISGGDREFLRLDLKGKALVFQTAFLKFAQLIIVLFALVGMHFFHFSESKTLWTLGLGSWCVLILSAVFSRYLAKKTLIENIPINGENITSTVQIDLGKRLPAWPILKSSLKEFSLWQHLQANLFNWGRTLDVWILGWVLHSVRDVGLYSSALKVANLSTLVPSAMVSVVSIWLGRKGGAENDNQIKVQDSEWQKLLQALAVLLAGCLLQALVLLFFAPYLFEWISRGRFSEDELFNLSQLFLPLLISTSLLACFFVFCQWTVLRLRENLLQSVLRVLVPWFLLIYVLYSQVKTAELMAWASVVGAFGFAILATVEGLRVRRVLRQTGI